MYRQTYMMEVYTNMSPAIAISCDIHGHILHFEPQQLALTRVREC